MRLESCSKLPLLAVERGWTQGKCSNDRVRESFDFSFYFFTNNHNRSRVEYIEFFHVFSVHPLLWLQSSVVCFDVINSNSFNSLHRCSSLLTRDRISSTVGRRAMASRSKIQLKEAESSFSHECNATWAIRALLLLVSSCPLAEPDVHSQTAQETTKFVLWPRRETDREESTRSTLALLLTCMHSLRGSETFARVDELSRISGEEEMF